MKKHTILLFLFASICFGQIKKEIIEYKNYGESKVSEKIIRFDSKGFLWYNTLDGFVRYSGKTHDFFEIKFPENQKHVADLTRDFLFTNNDKLLAASYYGVLIFDTKTGNQKWLSLNDEKGERYPFNSIKKDSKTGLFWLTTVSSKYVFSLSLETNTLKKYEFYCNKCEIEFIKENYLILKNHEGIYKAKLDPTSSLLKTQVLYDFNETNTKAIISDNGAIVPKDKNDSYFYKKKEYKYKTYKDIDCQIIEIPFEDAYKISKKISNYGVLMLDKSVLREYFFEFTNDKTYLKSKKNGLLIKSVLFESNNKFISYKGINYNNSNLWIPTKDNFVKLSSSMTITFKNYLNKEATEIGCRTIDEFGDEIKILTYNGFFSKHQNDNYFKKIDIQLEEKYIPKSLFFKSSYGFHKINDSIILVYGFYKRCVIKINLKTNRGKELFLDTGTSDLKSLSFLDIISYNDKELFLAGNYGLYRCEFDPTKDLTNYNLIDESQLSKTINIKDYYLTKLYLDKKNQILWIGTRNEGLYTKNLITGEATVLNKKLTVTDIFKDTENNIWVGTMDGLYKYNSTGKLLANYNKLNGLKHSIITTIQESKTHIWAGTYNGLLAVNKKTDQIHFFFKEDGISNNEFNKKSAFKTKDGQLYFGSIDGLTFFDPKNITIATNKHKLHLISLSKYNHQKKIPEKLLFDLENIQTVTLSPYKNYISLEFAVGNVNELKDIEYQYRLNDNPWVVLDRNTIQLQGLADGEHHIQIMGVTKSGFKTNVLNYTIEVEKVFYKKTWFFLLSCFIIFLIIFYFYKFKQKQLVKLHKKNLNELSLKSKLSLNLMSPHFIFNILTGLQATTLIDDVEEANKNFENYANILRQTLDLCNKESIPLSEEIAYIENYVKIENSLLNSDIQLSITIGSEINIDTTEIPTMMIQPIVENSIQHGLINKLGDKQLSISFNLENHFLIISIEDNGVGRDFHKENKSRKSWAIKMIKNRMEISSLLGNQMTMETHDLKDTQNQATGTKVKLKIQIPKQI